MTDNRLVDNHLRLAAAISRQQSFAISTSFVFTVLGEQAIPLRSSAKGGQDHNWVWLGEVSLVDFARVHVQLPSHVIALGPDLPQEMLVAVRSEYELAF